MKPSTLHLVPPLVSFLGLRSDLKLEAFHRLHTVVIGAAPLGPAAATRFVESLRKPDLFMQEGTHRFLTEMILIAVITFKIKINVKFDFRLWND